MLQIAPPLICDAAVLDQIVERMGGVLSRAGEFMGLGSARVAGPA